MRIVHTSICPGCSTRTLALIALDATGRRVGATCQECGHAWSLVSDEPMVEHA